MGIDHAERLTREVHAWVGIIAHLKTLITAEAQQNQILKTVAAGNSHHTLDTNSQTVQRTKNHIYKEQNK